ncbi:very short patch repair endonuclease [Parabacteroides merdae]|uniref:Very short patch repair endonuclease n=1 Tax=Parabacteroides merdae TaxID=46503 RepID=A0A7K1HHL3_9BACT|nr:very short patch repair endonuclease [Parabacteroides merdae]MTU30704.1 DNA mismatch endonuclease Vsr [Parabacteroides merdae]RYS82578.1 DNA mismatch endonuclease Vsr [Parabacteroides merdae]
MADVHSKQVRSYNMSMIRSKNTKPEMIVRKYLFSSGFRYRVNVQDIKGKPDIVFTKYRIVIFINGCFWHGHPNCKIFVLPKTNTEWWKNKIEATRKRDEENLRILKAEGWHIITIWECQLKKKNRLKTLQWLSFQISRYILAYYQNKE